MAGNGRNGHGLLSSTEASHGSQGVPTLRLYLQKVPIYLVHIVLSLSLPVSYSFIANGKKKHVFDYTSLSDTIITSMDYSS